MAKLTIRKFFEEMKNSVSTSVNIPAETIGKAVLVNCLCNDTKNEALIKQRSNFISSAPSIKGFEQSSFADAIGYRALNIFSLPYLVISGTRQLLQKTIDRMDFEDRPGLSHPRKSSRLTRVLKGVIGLVAVPFETAAFLVAKASDLLIDGVEEKVAKKDKSSTSKMAKVFGGTKSLITRTLKPAGSKIKQGFMKYKEVSANAASKFRNSVSLVGSRFKKGASNTAAESEVALTERAKLLDNELDDNDRSYIA